MNTSGDLVVGADENSTLPAAAIDNNANSTEQFISFAIGEEEYGVSIMSVVEIKGWTDVTTLPNTPPYVRGVLNLRGTIVPIFDMRCRFGQGLTEATQTHVVIILSLFGRSLGILVDAVSDILTVEKREILPVPEMERAIDEEYLSGLVTIEDRMVALVSLEKLFGRKTIESVGDKAGAALPV